MLVEGGVVDARRQQHDAGVVAPVRSEFAQRGGQRLPVALHLAHPAAAVEAAHGGLHRLAVGNHVGDARRHPQIVLEHAEAVMGAHQVGAADGHPGAVGNVHAPHPGAVLGAVQHHVGRDDAVGHDAAGTVDVAQKTVERGQALDQARLQPPPFVPGEQARQAVHRDDPLLGLVVVAIEREGDALVGEGTRHPFLDGGQPFGVEGQQGVVERAGLGAGRAVGLEHLVIDGIVEIVCVELHRHRRAPGATMVQP